MKYPVKRIFDVPNNFYRYIFFLDCFFYLVGVNNIFFSDGLLHFLIAEMFEWFLGVSIALKVGFSIVSYKELDCLFFEILY